MSSTRLGPSNSLLPAITPHLMPFHVAHAGFAPLSTYFIIKPALQPDTNGSTSPSLTQRVKACFTSAFRGRKIQGLTVKLPDGYSGIVFQTEELGTSNGKDIPPNKQLASANIQGQKGRRATRSSTRIDADTVDREDVTVKGDTLEEGNGVIQTLRPTAKFSSFTLWNADVDVDEGRDEYLRALSEYQLLLSEIHRIHP